MWTGARAPVSAVHRPATDVLASNAGSGMKGFRLVCIVVVVICVATRQPALQFCLMRNPGRWLSAAISPSHADCNAA
jgi:hypothetical protein